jgi:hypothetical protein
MSTFSEALTKMEGQDLLLKLDPEVPDFTDLKRSAKLIIQGGGLKISLPLSTNPDEILRDLSSFPYIFSESSLIVGWGIKSLFSYFRGITGSNFSFGSIWDLKIIERFMGLDNSPPDTLKEAKIRLSKMLALPSWESFQLIYEQVYMPLITEVIPAMETEGLADIVKKHLVYAYYEPEGQINGRMKCSGVFSKNYVPHTMGSDIKKRLRPTKYDDVFMYFDFKNMEVAVLQWLSKDPALWGVLNSGQDAYEIIWQRVTGLKPDEYSRERGKKIFLPAIFGMGASTLSKRLKTDEKTAATIIDRLYKAYPIAFSWVKGQFLEDDFGIDYFGRRRKFDQGNIYKIRNFVIQAPASVICLAKLVKLYQNIKNLAKLAFHVHDGFCIIVDKTKVKKLHALGTSILESSDELFPNLKLTTACEVGVCLNELTKEIDAINRSAISNHRE